jgi:hypothetical protein
MADKVLSVQQPGVYQVEGLPYPVMAKDGGGGALLHTVFTHDTATPLTATPATVVAGPVTLTLAPGDVVLCWGASTIQSGTNTGVARIDLAVDGAPVTDAFSQANDLQSGENIATMLAWRVSGLSPGAHTFDLLGSVTGGTETGTSLVGQLVLAVSSV